MSLKVANRYIARFHRHHRPVVGEKFSISAWTEDRMVGVAIVGRPVARGCPPDQVAEVTRCCTDGTYNVPSLLYGAAARAAEAMGYRRIQTYLLASEPGTSLKAAGWREDGRVAGRA